MKKIKKLCCLLTSFVMAFAAAPMLAEAAVSEYRDDFQSYVDAAAIFQGEVWDSHTNPATATLELLEEDGNRFISLNSLVTSDSILLSKNSLFTGEHVILDFDIRGETAPREMNAYCASMLLRVDGKNDQMMDFGYNCVRYKDTALATFAPGKWFRCRVSLTRGVDQDGMGKLEATFSVENSKPISLQYTGLSPDFSIQLGAKSIKANPICVDNLVVQTLTPISATLNLSGDREARLGTPLLLNIAEADPETVTPAALSLNGNTSGFTAAERQEDGVWLLIPAEPLKPDTAYTVGLPGVRGQNGEPVSPDSFSFQTRRSGLHVFWDGGDWIIRNGGAVREQAVVVYPAFENGVMRDISAEKLDLDSGVETSRQPEPERPVYLFGPSLEPLEASAFLTPSDETSELFQLSFSEEEQTISVSGRAEQSRPGRDVAVWVLNPGAETPNLDSPEQAAKTVQFVGMTQTREDGCFAVRVPVSGVSGAYRVIASVLDQQWTDTVHVRSADDIQLVLDTVNTSGSAAAIGALFERCAEVIHVDFPAYDACADKTFIYQGLIQNAAEQGGYRTLEALVKDVRELTVLELLNTAPSGSLAQLISEYEAQVRLTEVAVYEAWAAAEDHLKAAAAKTVQGRGYHTMEQYRTALSEEFLLCAVADSYQYAEVKKLLETYPEVLGLDMTEYQKAGSPAYVAKNMAGKAYQSCAALKTDFDRLVKEYQNQKTSPPDRSPGGGASSGSGGRRPAVPGGVSGGTSGTVATVPEPPPAEPEGQLPAPSFSDLDEAEWAANTIVFLSTAGVVDGFEDGTFRPNELVTREQFLKLALTAAALPLEEGGCGFSDVLPNEWYCPYLSTAVRLGVIRGKQDGSFGVGEPVIRQDAAVILYGVLQASGGLPERPAEMAFEDGARISDYAAEAVGVLSGLEILKGLPGGLFAPLDFCTRAEAAEMIYRMIEVIQ